MDEQDLPKRSPEITLVEEEIYTHIYLWNTHKKLRKIWEEGEHSDGHVALSSLLMAYLAFEAFINFCGKLTLPQIWEQERTYFRKKNGPEIENKLTELQTAMPGFVWEKGKRPYQSIRNLRKLRDSVSHGKLVRNQYLADYDEDGSHFKCQFQWFDHIEQAAFGQAASDIHKFCGSLLLVVRNHSDHDSLTFPVFSGPFASASSGPPK